MRVRFSSVTGVLWLIACVACGKDSPQATGASAGSGGGAGSDGKSGVPCGAKACKPPVGFSGELCCHDVFTSECGQRYMDQCVALPVQKEPNCPDGTISEGFGAVFARGCCVMDTNQCGLDVTGAISLGISSYCTALSDAAASMVTPTAGASGTSTIPPATNCDGTPGM